MSGRRVVEELVPHRRLVRSPEVPLGIICLNFKTCTQHLTLDQDVILANCGHIICSAECLATLRAIQREDKAPGILCTCCQIRVEEMNLATKVKVKNMYSPAQFVPNQYPLCDICVFYSKADKHCGKCNGNLCKNCDAEHPFIRFFQHHPDRSVNREE